MGQVRIENLTQEYVNRRRVKRQPGDFNQAGAILRVLDDVSVGFEDGEMVCILGPSGCGKSTMLRIIAGFDNPTSGRVMIDSKEVKGPSSDHIFVFQNNGLLPWMTVWQNVELGVRHMSDEKEKRDLLMEYLDMVELTGFENHYPNQLSGGMQRRAELVRALVVNPDILYMDEPFTGLDYLTQLRIREEVVNLHQYIGKTMIMVTHFIEDAVIMADRIIVMSERPSTIKAEYKLNMGRPRNLEKDKELADIRDDIFLKLGVSNVV